MPAGTPSPRATTNRASTTTRTARPLMGRPLRLDLAVPGEGGGGGGGGGGGAFSTEPLARIPDWSSRPSPADAETHAHTLTQVVDRAAAQVLILRKAVEEAAVADRAVRQHASDLAQRIAQGQRFASEFDQRLERASKAAGVIEKASAALTALEAVVTQVRTAQEAVTRTLDARLRTQETMFEQRLAQQQEVFERRMGEMAAAFDDSITRLTHQSEEAGARAHDDIAEHRKTILQQTEQACADADRHVAQTQARAALILDGVSDRIDVLQQQCDRIGNEAQQRLDALCARAAQVLGHDPRSDFAGEPRLGSLADAAARADALILGVDEAAVRIAAMRSSTEDTLARLAKARDEADRTTIDQDQRLESARQTIALALDESQRVRAALEDAVRAQADAAAKSAQASDLLSRQREDLAAIAEAGRYHVEQCRAAQQTLAKTIDQAAACSTDLDHALLEVRSQAMNVVAVAKDAAALVRQKSEGEPGRS